MNDTAAPLSPPSAAPPSHKGHRARLRERFLKTGGEGLADYELLELLLFSSHPRSDTKPLAKRLLAHFGGFAATVTAEDARLRQVEGMSDAAVTALRIAKVAAERLLREQAAARPLLGNWQALLDYCRVAMGYESVEQFRILFLDNKNRLIADEIQNRGTVNHTGAYPREVVRRGLELGASAVILLHNHPSGDPTPSQADITMTEQIQMACQAVGIALHDHLVIGRDQHYSFKSHDLL